MTNTKFDVAILGSGISGTALGAILAKHGARVLILENGAHPKFAIGESTVPGTSMMWRIIAERYGIPEFKNLTSFYKMRRHISSACGIKRNFGFIFHRAGEKVDPREFTQCIIPELPTGPESHMYRQDIDAYLLFVAIRYGAVVHQQTTVTEVNIDAKGVELDTARGEHFFARYVVDCGGLRAPLASRYKLREDPTHYKTHSRSIYTHMIGVRPFDDCLRVPGQRWTWFEGTLHHIFDGGWMWVIPFNNWRGATNPLCSVGLNLDLRRYPVTGLPPGEEFRSFLDRHPSIAPQFEHARPVREWVSADRLQYSSTSSVGDRYCLMIHAAGFIDPLFSRGLENTTVIINSLSDMILKALRDDDFSAERLSFIDRLQRALLDHNDRLVNCCYQAFSDFTLWAAYHQLWNTGTQLGALRLFQAYAKFKETGDVSYFRELDNRPRLGLLCPDSESYNTVFEKSSAEVDEVRLGRLSPAVAAERIQAHLSQSELAKMFEIGSCLAGTVPAPEKYSKYNIAGPLRMLWWGKNHAPAELKRLYFDYKPQVMTREFFDYIRVRLPRIPTPT